MDWGYCVESHNGVNVATLKCLEAVFRNVLLSITGLAGIALFIMLATGGFKYLTSGGDPKAAESAKNTMTFALVGVGLMGLAYIIFTIIGKFTGVEGLLNFQIPTKIGQ